MGWILLQLDHSLGTDPLGGFSRQMAVFFFFLQLKDGIAVVIAADPIFGSIVNSRYLFVESPEIPIVKVQASDGILPIGTSVGIPLHKMGKPELQKFGSLPGYQKFIFMSKVFIHGITPEDVRNRTLVPAA